MQDFYFNPAFLSSPKEVSLLLFASCFLHFPHKSILTVRPMALLRAIYSAAWQKNAAHFFAFEDFLASMPSSV